MRPHTPPAVCLPLAVSLPRAALPSAPAADPRVSRSLVRGLSILARMQRDGRERGIVELARELGMSPSTAYRYAHTLVVLGLLERSPSTHRYRAASARSLRRGARGRDRLSGRAG